MFNKYYEDELYKLREQASAFAKEHPITAPLLTGPTIDPGAERMLEGMAFLSGMLNQKLDNEFSRFTKDVIELVYPQFLRPIPATSVVMFDAPYGANTTIVESNTTLATNKIENTACLFQTIFDIEVNPLKITETSIKLIQDTTANLEIQLSLNATTLDRWQPQKGLYLFLGSSYTRASYIYMLLGNHLSRIALVDENGKKFYLDKNSIEHLGLDLNNKLINFPSQSFATFSLLQDFFILPHKFFFFKLTGFDKWLNRSKSNKFSIIFELNNISEDLPQVNNDTFILNAVPVINLFEHEMDPIRLDHFNEKLLLKPSTANPQHYQIYDIESINSYQYGVEQPKEYVAISSNLAHKKDSNVYQMTRDKSIINDLPEVNLFFPYREKAQHLQPETLIIKARCTNYRLPEKLKIGDICKHTFETPENLSFRNILQPTLAIEPPSDTNTLNSFISSLSLNFLSLEKLDNLKSTLKLFIPRDDQDKPRLIANDKRIDGIIAVKISAIDKISRGRVIRGQGIEIEVDKNQFVSIGDVYLFGAVLNSFFSAYTSINTFTQLTIKESTTGAIFKWPSKVGNKILI